MSGLRMAVVGVGALGRHHARILAGTDHVDLVAVADIDGTRACELAGQFGTEWSDDYRTLLDRVDAVSIAVPTTAHLAVAAPFLQRRIPVLVEKPLACSATEARQLVDLARRTQTLLQVGHVERFNPAASVVRQSCGDPRYIRAERLSPYSFRSTDIGVVHDMMIHDLDLVLDLVGQPVARTEAFGVSLMGEHEDMVQARLTFANGCIADLTASRIHPSARRCLQVWSFENCVTADLQSRQVTRYAPSHVLRYGTSPVELARQPGAEIDQLKQDVFGRFIQVETLAVPDDDALTLELASFIACVQTGRTPLVGGTEALDAMILADQVVTAVTQHPWDTAFPNAVGPFPQLPWTARKAG